MVRYTTEEKDKAKRIKIEKIKVTENIDLIAELHKDHIPF